MVLEGLAGERAKEEEASSEEVLSSEEEACSEEEEGVVISGGDQGGGGGGEQDQGHGEQRRDMAAGATSSSQAWPEPDPDPTGSSAELPLAVPGALALRPEPLAAVISGSGRILPEKECQLNTIEEEHLRYTREGLAGTVFRKALGIEAGPSRRPVGNASFMHSPHPPPGPRNHRGLFPPLGREATGRSQQQEERSEVKGPNAVKYMTSLSPVVNTGLIPAPPPPQQKRGNTVRSEVTRGRKLCPVSVPTEAEHPPRKNSGVVSRSLVRSGARVTVALVGKNLCLPGKAAGDRQHCGGENLCMYKGRLLEGEYDDDIEAEERQIDDQMSGTSESPSGDEKPDLDTEKESETLSEKALEVSDSEKDEDDKYSDSDFWDDEQAPDGTFVAEGRRTLDVQEASEKAGGERTMLGETKAIEEARFVEEEEVFTKEAGEEVERLGDLLPEDEAVAVLQAEGQPVVEESAPEESAMAEGDPKAQGIGKGRAFGIEMTPGEQGVLVEGMESEAELEERGTGEEEVPGAGELLDEEESRMQPEGRGGAEESSESDEEESEEEESDGEEDMEEGDTSGEDDMASDMSEGEKDGVRENLKGQM
ncbi:uncharacterized protein LOC141969734 [Athene noctua]|uniref:uncharacterized protein LOC141969734 n=1 Tax=Athene noctua TaxID=126797 RepID=UPI003EBC36D5